MSSAVDVCPTINKDEKQQLAEMTKRIGLRQIVGHLADIAADKLKKSRTAKSGAASIALWANVTSTMVETFELLCSESDSYAKATEKESKAKETAEVTFPEDTVEAVAAEK